MTNQAYKPEPVPTESTRPYWDAASRGELWVQRSKTTGDYLFYPRAHSPFGIDDELKWEQVSGRASLYSYVISHKQAPGFSPPYVIAIVELVEGPRMLSTIVGVDPDPSNLRLDMPLQVEFEQCGKFRLPVFRPVEPTEEKA